MNLNYLVTDRFTNISASLLNAIRIDLIENTECYYIRECKLIYCSPSIVYETLVAQVRACPIFEVASVDKHTAGIVHRAVYVCHLAYSNTDSTEPLTVYTSMVIMDPSIRFVHENIPLCRLMPGDSIDIELLVCPGTKATAGAVCDPTCVAAIRDFDRPWVMLHSVVGAESPDVVASTLLETKLKYSSVSRHTARYHNHQEGDSTVYCDTLINGAGHDRLTTVRSGHSLTVEYSIMPPLNNVLIIESVGTYTPNQLLDAAVQRVRRQL